MDPRDEFGGRSEADAEDFRERLAQLCRSLREEARLNALGHTLAYGQLTAAIRKRHALGRLWRQRPEFAATPISPPIAVVGQMRAGTTRVHRLLAADPAHTATRFCDSFDPVPKTADWRALKGAFALALARRINPWLDTLHPFGATRADEEIGWLSAALGPCAFEAQWTIPSYVEFSEGRDPGPVYSEFARILRTDAAIRRNADRPRVLKCPQYAEDLTALANTLPDTRIVAAQRANENGLPSTPSMVVRKIAL
ncbi:MAG: sulfotransferase, partial [Qipengyuania sp.]